MTVSPFAIAPFTEGMRKDLKAIVIPDGAFTELFDALIFRGRLKRREGYELLGRVARRLVNVSLGVINPAGPPFVYTFNIFTVAVITDADRNVIPGSFTLSIPAGPYTFGEDPNNPGHIIQTSGAAILDTSPGAVNQIDYTLNGGTVTMTFTASPNAAGTFTAAYSILEPIMGVRTRETTSTNQEDTIVWDQTYAYIYSSVTDSFQIFNSAAHTAAGNVAIWSGTDSQFFYTTNYQGSFWETNNKAGLNAAFVDNITLDTPPGNTTITTAVAHNFQTGDVVVFQYVNGTVEINNMSGTITVTGATTFTVNIASAGFTAYVDGGIAILLNRTLLNQDGIRYHEGNSWVYFSPMLNGSGVGDESTWLTGCLGLIPYRGYFVTLAPIEFDGPTGTNNQFHQRARYSQIGTVYVYGPVPTTETVDADAWRDDIFGRGGAIDASTNEKIIGWEFVKDVLVVYFERSTWRLRFTQNEVIPFVWERINRELGAEGTFSVVSFDKGVMGVGDRGIVLSDGHDTDRFDQNIPDEVFKINNENDGPQRVHGLRLYEEKLVYWTIPYADDNTRYPSRLLVYNYDNKQWAWFEDTFTALGVFQPSANRTWADTTIPWSQATFTWNEQFAYFENPAAGNQQGFVELLNRQSTNGPSLLITVLTAGDPGELTSPNNNLDMGDWIKITGVAGILNEDLTFLNDRNYKIFFQTSPPANTFSIMEFAPAALLNKVYDNLTNVITGDSAYIGIYPYSPEIDLVDLTPAVGTPARIKFKDLNGDGTLISSTANCSGTIDYENGAIELTFDPTFDLTDHAVIVRVVSDNQPLVPVATVVDTYFSPTGYYGGGYIAKINNIDAKTNRFNFFKQGKRARFSHVDMYNEATKAGEYTIDVFIDSNSTIPVNPPSPDNLRSNVCLTTPDPTAMPNAEDTMFRLDAQAEGQTFQIGIRMSDQQMAVDAINQGNIDISDMIIWARASGRVTNA